MVKVAFFVDWENFKQDIYTVQKVTRNRIMNFHDPEDMIKLFSGFVEEDEKILRIFFYSSYPLRPKNMFDAIMERKNLTQNQKNKFKKYFAENEKDLKNFYDETSSFFDDLAGADYISIRAGELKVNGLHEDASPIFVQKQVDMLMGLDIAHVSYRKHVDKVIIFSKDTDIRPALQTAQNNGIFTIIGNLENSYQPPDALKRYTDHVRTRSIKEIFSDRIKTNNNSKKNNQKKKSNPKNKVRKNNNNEKLIAKTKTSNNKSNKVDPKNNRKKPQNNRKKVKEA
ncbi:MAG: hypothetical protein C0601_04735 [Candidatus Muiribacterium halophilum]|uniref:NYN domain-containing protein n=1 Tax=Muiribacterium halophilum TaxID=2053465 RepID=A0A2N5ZI06_MUIH1|nr:MAG: hypothetical protein C0601_04735 [Candidatus Muirbacterium halophilum]